MRRLTVTLLCLLSPLRTAWADEAPSFIRDALAAGLGAGAELVLVEYRPTLPADCRPSEAALTGRLDGSGRGLLRLAGVNGRGAACDGYASVRAQVSVPVWVVQSAVAKGEPVGDRAVKSMRPRTGAEVVTDLDPAARSVTALAAGTVLEPRHLARADAPQPGSDIVVVVSDGPLTVTGKGRVVACGRDRICALMPGGRRVEGAVRDGRLYVETR
ncbi:MAG: hypothetical protein RL199_761 [Pseudomonadota bacterium]|jgi:flagella basal body P-ring formation protein FlgA